MTPHRSSLPDDNGHLSRASPAAAMSWGSRQRESETVSRAGSGLRTEDGLVLCPSCGSQKTTTVQSANRGAGNSIRRDNPGFKCFTCGTGWTVPIGDDRDLDESWRS